MKASSLKKNATRSVRINDEILEILDSMGTSVQKLLDEKLDELIEVEIKSDEYEQINKRYNDSSGFIFVIGGFYNLQYTRFNLKVFIQKKQGGIYVR